MTCPPPPLHHAIRVTVLDVDGHATDQHHLAHTGEAGSQRPLHYTAWPQVTEGPTAGSPAVLSLTVPDLAAAAGLARFVDRLDHTAPDVAIEVWSTALPQPLSHEHMQQTLPPDRPLLYLLCPRVRNARAHHARSDRKTMLAGQLLDHAPFTPYRYGSTDLPALGPDEVLHLGFVDRAPVPLLRPS
jgi:hypothetical protein